MAGPGPFPVPMTMETSMIERLDTATLRSLTGPRTGPCVTLLLPTEHGPRGADAGKLGLKNLVAAARDELHGRIGSLQVDELLAPVEAILVEDSFWHDLGEGLACFLAPDLPGGRIARVPRPAGAFSYVGDRFAVTPLLPGFLREGYAPPAVQAGLFGLGHLIISGLVHGGIVLGAASAGAVLARTTGMEKVRKAMAIGIALVAVWLAWQTRR